MRKPDELKIFLISNMYPSADAPGFGSFVKNVADGLKDYGIDCSRKAIIRGRGKSAAEKIKKYLKFYKDIIAGFFRRNDAIYIHFPNQAIPMLKLLYLFRRPKLIANYHGEDLLYAPTGYGNRLGRMTENFLRRHASAIIVPSQYFKQIVVDRGIAPAEKVIVSPSGGYNPDIFHSATKENTFNPDVPIRIGCVGRMEPEKGIIEFLDLLENLTHQGVNFRATAIGYGSLLEMAYNFRSEFNLEDKFTIIEGVAQKELGDYYRNFDLLIFCSRASESLGLTGIEAMACGTPVVGSRVGGIMSYLRDGENGFLVSATPSDSLSATGGKSTNAIEILEAVNRYMAMTPEERSRMSQRAIETSLPYAAPAVICRLAASIRTALGY